jgi:hypothetical protein
VQAVGQLHQDDADVLGHGQGHLLEVLGLHFRVAAEGDLVELADAVDHLRNGIAELAFDGGLADAGVLDDVVQHGCHQTLRVHVHFGEDAGNGQGVCDVGVTTAPELAIVGLFRVVVGTADKIDLLPLQVGGEAGGERVDCGHKPTPSSVRGLRRTSRRRRCRGSGVVVPSARHGTA